MGIQINGITDTISATDGGLAVSGQQLTGVTDINASGIVTATQGYVVGTGASIFSPAANTLAFGTNNSERVRVDSSGKLGIGTAPATSFHVNGSGDQTCTFQTTTAGADNRINFRSSTGTDAGGIWYMHAGNHLLFNTGGSNGEKARIDGSGRLLVGTATVTTTASTATNNLIAVESTNNYSGVSFTANCNDSNGSYLVLKKSRGTSTGSNTVVQSGDEIGNIFFEATDGSASRSAASIRAFVDATPGASDMPGRLVFATTADGASSPTERMWITSNGAINMGANNGDPITNQVTGFSYGSDQILRISRSSATCFGLARRTTDGSIMDFHKNTTIVGSVSVTGTATAYNTSSDYRLKENVTPVADGITRLQQLKPSRFNFIADPGKTVDGFLAHEAAEVVPECVTGEKDALDADGNPVYQGIDQSKLVPLLTAALQEAIGEIESLKARVVALENA